MGLDRHTTKYIERHVATHHKTKSLLKHAPADIQHHMTNASHYVCDPQTKRYRRMAEITRAIEKTYTNMSHEKQKLVILHYWQRHNGLTWEGIGLQLHISRKTALRWRNEFIEEIALELGEE